MISRAIWVQHFCFCLHWQASLIHFQADADDVQHFSKCATIIKYYMNEYGNMWMGAFFSRLLWWFDFYSP